jgi:hypothetical protein
MAEIKVYIVKIIKGRAFGNWYNQYIGKEFFVIQTNWNGRVKYKVVNNPNFKYHYIDLEDAEIT